ncbi:MAG TPA: hypothetical protein VEA69_21765 [Tepidisphaeraceae bacterium]|nr:hypothetical protein [Tepidisphaeraceae bacterium]
MTPPGGGRPHIASFARPVLLLALCCCSTLAPGCFAVRGSAGGGQVAFTPPRAVNPADVAVPPGYRIEVVTTGLTFPSAVAFDDQNRPHVVEAGYSYGEQFATPRLLRVEPGGATTVVAAGDKETGPWTGAAFHDGAFYVAQGGELAGGRIVRITPDGKTTPLVENLPTRGDHHTNGPAIGPDGYLYFGVGTATNAAVVGTDNFEFGWLKRHPGFHDIPAKDVRLTGKNFESDNPLTPDPNDRATTGAYVPFGTATTAGQVIPGRMPCNGAVLRVPARGGGTPELVAWGLRNPFGLAFDPAGTLYVTENQYDVRGSRPVYGTGDLLWAIRPGTWYGWPDFHGGEPLTWHDHFKSPHHAGPEFLLAEHPNPAPQPAARLGVHAAAGGLDFSRDAAFGHRGEAFVALFGDMSPKVGKVLGPVGYHVVRVDPSTGVVRAFAVNRGPKNGPASLLKSGGLERPVAVRFAPDGRALYVVDFGVMTVTEAGPRPFPGTGVLWRITREDSR